METVDEFEPQRNEQRQPQQPVGQPGIGDRTGLVHVFEDAPCGHNHAYDQQATEQQDAALARGVVQTWPRGSGGVEGLRRGIHWIDPSSGVTSVCPECEDFPTRVSAGQ